MYSSWKGRPQYLVRLLKPLQCKYNLTYSYHNHVCIFWCFRNEVKTEASQFSYVRLPVCRSTHFHKILYKGVLLKFAATFQFWFNPGNISENITTQCRGVKQYITIILRSSVRQELKPVITQVAQPLLACNSRPILLQFFYAVL